MLMKPLSCVLKMSFQSCVSKMSFAAWQRQTSWFQLDVDQRQCISEVKVRNDKSDWNRVPRTGLGLALALQLVSGCPLKTSYTHRWGLFIVG